VNWVVVISWATGAASLGVKFVGFPCQVRKGQTNFTFAAAACVSYALWVVHGALTRDWTEVLSQGMGVVTTGILVVQAVTRKPELGKPVSSLQAHESTGDLKSGAGR
jgi:hypothetical protein